ncbi:hypothetical protein AAW00_12460 [Aurantiacibacter luteus]|uniref:RDD domain-containing protein n=1 Tax=Aurantiacibacter luteus TaxID=1581420 RepID=A0A0G9MT17_9SPHN|nr:hypothetical protein AAW00_12460 [Aurantiacibacter luteus]
MRTGAYIIDSIILYIVQMVIAGVFGLGAGATTALDPAAQEAVLTGGGGLLILLMIVIGVAYFAVMESGPWQATLGKKALGLIVTDLNGNRISLARAIGRYFGKFLSSIILLIGFIMVAFTEKKQGLHDMLASTLVVKGQPGQFASRGVFE